MRRFRASGVDASEPVVVQLKTAEPSGRRATKLSGSESPDPDAGDAAQDSTVVTKAHGAGGGDGAGELWMVRDSGEGRQCAHASVAAQVRPRMANPN